MKLNLFGLICLKKKGKKKKKIVNDRIKHQIGEEPYFAQGLRNI